MIPGLRAERVRPPRRSALHPTGSWAPEGWGTRPNVWTALGSSAPVTAGQSWGPCCCPTTREAGCAGGAPTWPEWNNPMVQEWFCTQAAHRGPPHLSTRGGCCRPPGGWSHFLAGLGVSRVPGNSEGGCHKEDELRAVGKPSTLPVLPAGWSPAGCTGRDGQRVRTWTHSPRSSACQESPRLRSSVGLGPLPLL